MNHTTVQFNTVRDTLLSSSLAGQLLFALPHQLMLVKSLKRYLFRRVYALISFAFRFYALRHSANILNHITECLTNLVYMLQLTWNVSQFRHQLANLEISYCRSQFRNQLPSRSANLEKLRKLRTFSKLASQFQNYLANKDNLLRTFFFKQTN